jgi:hypothetical protein
MPSRLASGALKRASGGTRTPGVCIPLYKSGAVAAEPHWHEIKKRAIGLEPTVPSLATKCITIMLRPRFIL